MMLGRLLDFRLFNIGTTPVTVATAIAFAGVLLVAYVLSRLLQKTVERILRLQSVEIGSIRVARRLAHYAVMALGLAVGMQTVGINLSALFAAGAVFAVGLGFGMQNIAENFVSGVILLIEHTIKPGDVLEVQGEVVRVRQMGIRATIVRTRNEEELIVPNSKLVQSAVKNYTLGDPLYRVRAQVGVSYSCNVPQVRQLLEQCGEKFPDRVGSPHPVVQIKAFGNSTIDFEVSIWVDRPWDGPLIQSKLLEAMWLTLTEHHVTIAFPQLDVHFDPEIQKTLDGLRGLKKAS